MAVDHHVFGFDVTVEDIEVEKSFETAEDLGCIELDPGRPIALTELHAVLILNDPVQALPREVLKDEVKMVQVRESFDQTHDVVEWTSSLPIFVICHAVLNLVKHHQDIFLILDVLDSLGLVDLLLWYPLECMEVVLVDDEVDGAELAAADLYFWVLVGDLFDG